MEVSPIIGCKSETKEDATMNKEYLYQVISGYYHMDMIDIPEGMTVENEFAAGTECSRLYARAYAAKQRLLARLHEADEDDDIDMIICSLESISKILAMKMYDYGTMEKVWKEKADEAGDKKFKTKGLRT
jgi:hypothetical protein